MKIPIGTVLIFLLNITALQAQDLQPTQAGWDTLRLHLKARKVVAYNTGQVTFLVNYKDFAKEFYAFYRMHKNGLDILR